MENNDNIIMSRFAFERVQAKEEVNDIIKSVTIILLIVLLVASNAMWLWAWNQYEYVVEESTVELEADGDSNANYIGNNGDITNGGEDKGQEEENEQG